MKRYAVALAALALTALPAGCGGSRTATPEPAQEDTVTRTDQPSPQPDGRQGVTADAVRDLSERLDTDASAITVVSTEEVTWRDGSLGCPKPGMMYTQALTDGSRVVLESNGKRYEYHAGGRRSAFLCENPEPPAKR